MSAPPSRSGITHPTLQLGLDLSFEDLYTRDGLLRLDQHFLRHLREVDAALAAHLDAARSAPGSLARKPESDLLIALAPHLEDFLSELFGIEDAVTRLAARTHELAPLYSCKRLFVQRKAMNRIKPAEAEAIDGLALEAQLAAHMGGSFTELGFAQSVSQWQKDEAAHAGELALALRYAAWAV
ncbi:MAG TPA: hypothetical protein VEK05_02825, partial [Burkholderiales bacterium]|nr:hypothetical protein [Burkholderiales bacterium]